MPLRARAQPLRPAGREGIRRQVPVPVRGIASATDSACIHEPLLASGQHQGVTLPHSRAYQKNDPAGIEPKHGAVVRRFLGGQRLTGRGAGPGLAPLYPGVRQSVNAFPPSFERRSQRREGAKGKQGAPRPATPWERLLDHPAVAAAVKDPRRAERARLASLERLPPLREGQAALAALPAFWHEGDVRPTPRQEARRVRVGWTRKDPFAGVWLPDEPEAPALFARLERAYPGRFAAGQRRIREGRRVLVARQSSIDG